MHLELISAKRGKTNARGILSLEVFNKAYWKQDALVVAKTGLAKMKQVVEISER
jgi:hypothetical protein